LASRFSSRTPFEVIPQAERDVFVCVEEASRRVEAAHGIREIVVDTGGRVRVVEDGGDVLRQIVRQ